MLNTKFKSSLVAISVATVLSACGGGGGGTPTAATSTNVIASGSIEQFGSVYVNGVRYETTESTALRSDDTGSEIEYELELGEVITLQGQKTDDSNGVATSITVDDELVGTLTSLDSTSLTLKVMGQTINVTSSTIIDDSLLADSAVDAALGSRLLSDLLMTPGTTVLEISGHPGGNGIDATRIESTTASPTAGEAEVKGIVANLLGSTFKINELDVDFSSLIVSLTVGDFVEVKGTFNGTDTITATSIEIEDENISGEDEIEVEGVIQAIEAGTLPAGTIKVNGFTFDVADISLYSVGMKVEVKIRTVNGNTTTTIKNETEDNIRIRDQADGPVASGVIPTRLGLNVTISDRTRLELDDAMNTGEILAGTYIEARGFKLDDIIVWTRIEASNEDSKEECRLRGAVGASPADPSFTIEGVTVTTDINTQFRDANDALIDSTTFFGLVTQGDIVQAKSASNGTACGNNGGLDPAKEVSFEPEDDVLEGGDDNGNGGDDGADNELKGAVSSVVDNGDNTGSFVIGSETITVTANTLIDDSLIEALGGPELNADQTFENSGASLVDLLPTSGTYVVTVDRSSGSAVATSVEDFF